MANFVHINYLNFSYNVYVQSALAKQIWDSVIYGNFGKKEDLAGLLNRASTEDLEFEKKVGLKWGVI